jgi:hypothetical protein
MSYFRQILIFLMTFLLTTVSVFALTDSLVTLKRTTAPFFILDSNTPCASGPRAAHIGIKIINKSATDTLFGLQIRLDSIVGDSRFKLIGPADSSLNSGRLLPRDSSTTYFYVKYPCTKDLPATFYFKISDKRSGFVRFNTTVATRSSISANAGGDVISHKLAYHDALGTILVDTVVFSFGNIQTGDELELQPCGDTTFNADKVILLNTKILASAVTGLTVGTQDKLYFIAPSNSGGSNNYVTMVFYFKNSLFSDNTKLNPYSGTTSGSSNFKYTSNFGVNSVGVTTTSSAIKTSITKSASCGICDPCDTVTYTIDIKNSFTEILQVDQLVDILPVNYKFLGFATGSEITKINSSQYPLPGDSGTITFTGFVADTIFPYESYKIYPGDTLSLKYRALTRCISSSSLDTNKVYLILNDFSIDTAFALTCAGCSALPVNLLYFNANRLDNQVLLEWATASEINNQSFAVYRSYEGVNYEFIQELPGAGNYQQITKYTAIDPYYLKANRVYYKLKQTDYDGKQTSYYAKLEFQQPLIIHCFPNPFSEELEIQFSEESQINTIVVSDFLGKIIQKFDEEQLISNQRLCINTSDWNKGLYVINCFCKDGKSASFRLIKE